jgi:hypothetical protein
MKFCTTKNPVFCPMGLRRAMQSALAIVATLALVSSAHAQTYTWTGASGTTDNWFTTTGGSFTSGNFSPSPLVSSTLTTNLVFEGTTRPNTVLNRSFSASSLTFNTGTGFTISPLLSQALTIGASGIVNQVAQQQTINTRVILESGTTPVNVVSGGEVVFTENVVMTGNTVLEKLGSGTVTFKANVVFPGSVVRSTAGTTNFTEPSADYQIHVEVNGGQLNLGPTSGISGDGVTRVTGGVFSALGEVSTDGGPGIPGFEMTSGTMIVGDVSSFSKQLKISGGTVVYSGTGGSVVLNNIDPTVRTMTIEGGSQDFGLATIYNDGAFPGSSVLVTGGTSTGFYSTLGLTNNGGIITFTARDQNDAALNDVVDLDLTSGTVSINAFGGGAIGALVNSVNTTLGAGNTLNLDFNEDLSRDLLITSGTLNWGGNVALNLTNGGEMPNGSSWNFFNDGVLGNTGAFAGTLDGISLAATDTYNGLSFTKSGSLWTSTATVGGQQFTFNETTGVLAVVPEPSSIAVVGMGLAMLGWRRLARRQRAAA